MCAQNVDKSSFGLTQKKNDNACPLPYKESSAAVHKQ